MTDEVKPAIMKALHLIGTGGYDKMKVVEIPKPKPGNGEVLVNVKACGVNFTELMCRQGMHCPQLKLPAVLGFEAAGDVVETGEGCSRIKEGDKVLCVKHFGLWSEFAVLSEAMCFIMPEKMSYEEGAALPVNYITAYHMLFDFGNMRKGKSVLIHMAAGGVGIAATQLCKMVPEVTVFGTSSASKHDMIRENGVSHPIDYRTKDYVVEVKKISPQGVDIVLDPLNGADATKGYNLLKPLGKIIHYGAANMIAGEKTSYWNMLKTYIGQKSYSPLEMMSSNKAAAGYQWAHLVEHTEIIVEVMTDLIDLYEKGKIKPCIDSIWAFEDIGKAMAQIHERKNIGKVVISPQQHSETDVKKEDKK